MPSLVSAYICNRSSFETAHIGKLKCSLKLSSLFTSMLFFGAVVLTYIFIHRFYTYMDCTQIFIDSYVHKFLFIYLLFYFIFVFLGYGCGGIISAVIFWREVRFCNIVL